MKAAAVRDRLYDYIRVAEDKKILAIYSILESEINEQTAWWEDNS